MRPRRLLACQDASEIFDQAVSESALAVLSLQDGDQWLTFKSRFLERDPNRRFIVLDYQAPGGEPLPPLIPGQYVGIGFRQRSRKILFASVVEAKGHYIIDEQNSVPAVRYRWPSNLTELQRRAYYRTPVPEGQHVRALLWPGGVAARTSGRSAPVVLHGELVNISCGGALVHLDQKPAGPAFHEDQTLGLELHLPDGRPPVLVDGCYRGARSGHAEDGETGHRPAETGSGDVAVQFVGLELSVDGRVTLQRLSNCVQRFHRQGLASDGRWSPGRYRP